MKINVNAKCVSCDGVIPCGSKHCPYKVSSSKDKGKSKKSK